jgi:hypothetical protein
MKMALKLTHEESVNHLLIELHIVLDGRFLDRTEILSFTFLHDIPCMTECIPFCKRVREVYYYVRLIK